MGNKLISFRYKLLSHVEAPRPRRLVRKKNPCFLAVWFLALCEFSPLWHDEPAQAPAARVGFPTSREPDLREIASCWYMDLYKFDFSKCKVKRSCLIR